MKIIRDCYTCQGHGYLVNIQIGYTCIVMVKTKSSRQFRMAIFKKIGKPFRLGYYGGKNV